MNTLSNTADSNSTPGSNTSGSNTSPQTHSAEGFVRVWDPLVRIFHWSLVASFAIAWFSAEEVRDLHEWAGYAAAALISFRLVWGVVGSHYARFGQFVKSPRGVMAYLGDMLGNREKRYIGHNPAGGAMILALLVVMGLTALTGWMYTTDRFWGEEWVEETHKLLGNGMLVLVLAHVAGVIVASRRHAENLARAMVTGVKRAAGKDDIA